MSGCSSGSSDSGDTLVPASGIEQEASVDSAASPPVVITDDNDTTVTPPAEEVAEAGPDVNIPVSGPDNDPLVDDAGANPVVDDPDVNESDMDPVSSVDAINDPDVAEPGNSLSTEDSAPAVVASRANFELVARLPFDDAIFDSGNSITPFAVNADGSRVVIKEGFSDANDDFVHKFYDYDVSSNSASLLLFAPIDDAFPAFDDTFTTMAYATPCTTSVQRPSQFSEPLILGAELTELCTSLQTVQISDDGETVLIEAFGDDGGAPLILGVSSGSVMALDNDSIQQADATFAGRTVTALDPSLSADGRYVTATVIATDGPIFTNGQNVIFSAGTVVVDTATGDIRVIGLKDYERFACRGCNAIPPVPAPAISGNGQYVVYAQDPEIQSPSEPAVEDSFVFRYNIDTGETQQVYADLSGVSEIVLSDSGTRAAYRVGGDVQVAYFDSDEILSLQEAFKFCDSDGNDCLFTSSRFVTSTVLEMSGDGSAITIYLIPEAGENASQQNRNELLHFNLDTGILSRVSQNDDDSSFTSISDDGDTVALIGVDDRREGTIDVYRQ